ncbi:uncharacterized protein LOC109421289 [Aedes albopictus]|uniref:F-box domain-containing protein n=1 Tax=Aedes albopictus TaxID=7160 RepID=A0ABM1Z522_AEDAL|nr:uncharacterized protein LOC109421289 [Aedes albopictus]
MSIQSLPMEVLQQIFTYFSYRELLPLSLVCHRWNEATVKFIVCKGKFNVTRALRDSAECVEEGRLINPSVVIGNIVRDYRAIMVDNWQQHEPTIAACVQRFPIIDALHLDEIPCRDLHCLYVTYQDWITQCSWMRISLRSCYRSKAADKPLNCIWNMPKLKRLVWQECDYDPLRTVTINAPNLESIYLKGSEGSSPGEIRLQCALVKHIECEEYGHEFPEKFITDLGSVETFQLTLENRIDLGFFRGLRQLTDLDLTLDCKMKSLDELMNVCSGLPITILNISCSIERSFINLEEFFANFTELESLTLSRVDFYAERDILLRQLKNLELRCVEYCEDVTLNVPSLTHLTLESDILDKIIFTNASSLSNLSLYLTSEKLKNCLEQTVFPFLDIHRNVESLTLINKRFRKNDDFIDKSTNTHVLSNLRSLELRWINVTVDFFRVFTESKQLQNLTLTDCNIDCTGLPDAEHIRLDSVERMVIGQRCYLKNTIRTDFPLLAGGHS